MSFDGWTAEGLDLLRRVLAEAKRQHELRGACMSKAFAGPSLRGAA